MSTGPFMAQLHQQRAVDAALDAYVQWREHRAAVWDAYDRWSRAAPKDKALAHAAYRAALDCEEAAATLYASHLEHVAALLEPTPRPQPATERQRQR